MLLVAPVAEARRKPVGNQEGNTPMERVLMVRSDIPAITHVDYSARVQTVGKHHHPRYRAVLEAFERLTGCAVIVNTSFNVRGEPIINTPQEAYRCFMNTEMDALLLEDCLLLKHEQPPVSNALELAKDMSSPQPPAPQKLLRLLEVLFERKMLPASIALAVAGHNPIRQDGPNSISTWHVPLCNPALTQGFLMPETCSDCTLTPGKLARAFAEHWQAPALTQALLPVMEELFALARRFPGAAGPKESVSNETYVMF